MKVTFDYGQLEAAVTTLMSVVSDKVATDTLKNVIFQVSENDEITMLAHNVFVTCYITVQGDIDWEGAAPTQTFFQLKSTCIKALLAYKAQKMTKATKVTLHIAEGYSVVEVATEAVDATVPYASLYAQNERFRVETPKMLSAIIKEVTKYTSDFEGTNINAKEIYKYLSSLLPTIAGDAKLDSVHNRIMFAHGYVYTAPTTYFALMPSRLDECFSNFVLTKSAAAFLTEFLRMADEDNVVVSVTQPPEGSKDSTVLIKVRHGKCTAIVRAHTASNALKCAAYAEHGNTCITLNRGYFNDIMRKAELMKEEYTFEFIIRSDGTAEGYLLSPSWRLPLAIETSVLDKLEFAGHPLMTEDNQTGLATLHFTYTPQAQIMRQFTFSHAHEVTSNMFTLYVEPQDARYKIAVTDDSGLWQTKLNAVSATNKIDYKWGNS